MARNSIDSNKLIIEPLGQIFRRDRNRHGGGVAVYISNSLGCKRLQTFEPLHSEIICLEIQLQSRPIKKLLLCACYRPPVKNTLDFLSDLDTCLEHCRQFHYDQIHIVGDFNAKHSDFLSTDINTLDGRQVIA